MSTTMLFDQNIHKTQHNTGDQACPTRQTINLARRRFETLTNVWNGETKISSAIGVKIITSRLRCK